MTLENMKVIATENNGTIPAGMAMTMTDLEVRRAIKYGYLKEDSKKVQSPEPKKNPRKEVEEGFKRASDIKAAFKTSKKGGQAEKKKELSAPVTTGTVSTFNKDQKTLYKKLDGIIYDRMNDVKKSSFDIAFALHIIYENGYFKIDGYKNIYDYARERYGISRGTTNNFINLVERFADSKNPLTKELKPEYSGYSSTQLICMLGYTDDELKEKNITPSMSSRDIKKALKESGNGSKGEALNSLNGGKSDSKKSDSESDTEDKETGNESAPKEFLTNLILELNSLCVMHTPELDEEFETFISGLLSEKVKVICKLLKSGHTVQILDILP